MKLFEVTRWGTDAEANGPDTNYLVCAPDHLAAAALVQPREPRLDMIYELADLTAEIEKPVVFRGPYIEHDIEYGCHFTRWIWDGHGTSPLATWVPNPNCTEGEARCHYADGKLAGICNWHKGKKHGESILYHANGQMMYRGMYRRGKEVGIHHWWFDNGVEARRHEGVANQYWDRDGRPVS